MPPTYHTYTSANGHSFWLPVAYTRQDEKEWHRFYPYDTPGHWYHWKTHVHPTYDIPLRGTPEARRRELYYNNATGLFYIHIKLDSGEPPIGGFLCPAFIGTDGVPRSYSIGNLYPGSAYTRPYVFVSEGTARSDSAREDVRTAAAGLLLGAWAVPT